MKPHLPLQLLTVLLLTGCVSPRPVASASPKLIRSYVTVLPTGSMRPALVGGELLTVVQMDWADLRPGMVCVYWNRQLNREVPVLHRIQHSAGRDRFVMKGDNNVWNDPGYMTPEDLLGVVLMPVAPMAVQGGQMMAGGGQ